MDEITIDDFFKVDLRIAKVVEVSEIEEADKLVQLKLDLGELGEKTVFCLLYTSPSPRDFEASRMPSSA